LAQILGPCGRDRQAPDAVQRGLVGHALALGIEAGETLAIAFAAQTLVLVANVDQSRFLGGLLDVIHRADLRRSAGRYL
jgi:hypothetical protein